MAMPDVFNSDIFSLVSLTDAINKLKVVPNRLGSLGWFRESGITTTTAVVEWKDGQLELVQSTPRGGPSTTLGNAKRTAESFLVPHISKESTIVADSIQGVRAFGSDNAADAVQAIVNQRMQELREQIEATLEYHRLGAVKGVILDADGTSTIHNLFTKFGVTQQTAELNLTAALRSQVVAAERLSEDVLGAMRARGYRALCGDDFFDAFIEATEIKNSLQYQEGAMLREDLRAGFRFAGVMWENYSGKIGTTPFLAADEAYLVPEADIFRIYNAPADFMETANTIGLPLYAKMAPDAEFNRFVKLHVQSNPLALCLRPNAIIKLTLAT